MKYTAEIEIDIDPNETVIEPDDDAQTVQNAIGHTGAIVIEAERS